jgi:hypothetical protein
VVTGMVSVGACRVTWKECEGVLLRCAECRLLHRSMCTTGSRWPDIRATWRCEGTAELPM